MFSVDEMFSGCFFLEEGWQFLVHMTKRCCHLSDKNVVFLKLEFDTHFIRSYLFVVVLLKVISLSVII